ncbi:MAG: PIN domain-containing protein [Actinobacteria bacterium]|nr:PIN domain-containing protein [Actinomycetota bacterium]
MREWLSKRPEQPVVSSELGRVEVLRAARRVGGRALTEAHAVVADIDLVPLDRAVHDLASDIGHPLLRTLDAIHLAPAVLLSDELTAFIAYGHRLTSAAEAAGLTVATPGKATSAEPKSR